MTDATSQPTPEAPPVPVAEPPPKWFQRKTARPHTDENPAKPPAARKRRVVRIEPVDDPVPTWKQQFARAICGGLGIGFGLSMLLHIAAIVSFAFWILDVENLLPDFVVSSGMDKAGVEEVQVDTELPVDLAMKQGGPAVKQPTELQPTDVTTPRDIDATIPPDLESRINQLANKDAGEGRKKGEGSGDADGSVPKGGVSVGENAVTKGRFTVWSIPHNPDVNQSYHIAIRVRLPDEKKRYRLTDLSGMVVGDDGHRQQIPHDKTWGPAKAHNRGRFINLSRKAFVPVRKRDGKDYAVIYIWVPGARIPKTIDTVNIRSKLLEEQQSLKIVF